MDIKMINENYVFCNANKIALFSSLCIGINLMGMTLSPQSQTSSIPKALQTATSVLIHKKRKPDPLYMQLDCECEANSVRQIFALAEQADTVSCGYRTLFHARCIDIANNRARKGGSFDKSMQELLLNVGMIKRTYVRIKSYLDTEQPSFDQKTGMDMSFLPEICSQKIRRLNGKILPTILESDEKTFMVVHDKNAQFNQPLLYTPEFIRNCASGTIPFSECKIEIDKSREIKYMLTKLSKPLQTAHFACSFPGHLFLVSMRTDEKGKVGLYVIDSNNNNINENPRFKTLVSKLLTYAQTLNETKNKTT